MDNLNFPMEDFSLEHVFAAILPSNLCALKAEPIYIVSNIFLWTSLQFILYVNLV